MPKQRWQFSTPLDSPPLPNGKESGEPRNRDVEKLA